MKVLLMLCLLLLTEKHCNQSKKPRGAIDDAIIVSGSSACNKDWSPVDVKNNSDSKFLTITVEESSSLNGAPPTKTSKVFEKIAPKEQRELGCKGCGEITTGRLCVSFKVVAAIYVE